MFLTAAGECFLSQMPFVQMLFGQKLHSVKLYLPLVKNLVFLTAAGCTRRLLSKPNAVCTNVVKLHLAKLYLDFGQIYF